MPLSSQGKQTVTTATTDPSSANTSKPSAASKTSLTKKFFGIVIGTIVGTPVCVVRKTIDEEKYAINGMVGTSDNKAAVTAAGVFWLPFSLFTGAVESPVFAAIDSVKAEEPFSRKQFSLGDVKTKSPTTQPVSP